ncbi:[NiFe] hydrogenase assembly chaperone, HybE family [Methylomagnum ishizawai]|uniref:[NiFe] hydrogenase assembly chaperone, HybE family n=1 Tax=Methylomagnum ishizawai TaxID=1760988 RepID=A0A1Y6DE62_9GAMM|nr:[NiFe]-hydrogenase assembly chaperone HybE [Methylomagnum ishizawai]SMF97735.1 [NiFe] hydrogenase assembly chaperone, HybE family [Methylomagnum ishizawai]
MAFEPDPSAPVARLVEVFERLARTGMADLPIANPALRVEAVGFVAWDSEWVGVLITPWAVNLMVLPGQPEVSTNTGLDGGAIQSRRFPSGVYGFRTGHIDGLGVYQSCSLFSPPGEFADQDAARAVALEIMGLLFQLEAALAPPPVQVSRRSFLRGRFGGPG